MQDSAIKENAFPFFFRFKCSTFISYFLRLPIFMVVIGNDKDILKQK